MHQSVFHKIMVPGDGRELDRLVSQAPCPGAWMGLITPISQKR